MNDFFRFLPFARTPLMIVYTGSRNSTQIIEFFFATARPTVGVRSDQLSLEQRYCAHLATIPRPPSLTIIGTGSGLKPPAAAEAYCAISDAKTHLLKSLSGSSLPHVGISSTVKRYSFDCANQTSFRKIVFASARFLNSFPPNAPFCVTDRTGRVPLAW